MPADLVIGLDSSTSATKAIAWDATGKAAAAGRSPVPLANPGPNIYEQDPNEWWAAAVASIREVTGVVGAERIAGVAICNQRETFVPLDSAGQPVRPAIIWLDQRCTGEVPKLAAAVGEECIHEVSGKPVDVAPVAYRIAWMKRHEPDLYRRTARFSDVNGYLTCRLTGNFRTSWASADPLGLLDMKSRQWSHEILTALDLSPNRLPGLAAPGARLGEITAEAAAATGLLRGTPVIAGGGDGQAAGLGVNALTPERAYLNLGTAAVSGIYSPEYRTGMAWRTMGSCSGSGYYLETSLRTGTFLVDWFVREVCEVDPATDPGIYARLEAAAAATPAGSGGLLLVPYWGAVMTPYWDKDARGCMVGFLSHHGRPEMYRSLLEGVALEQALVTGMIEERTGLCVKELIAIGGGAASDLWCQIIASAMGKTVLRSATIEASALGAGVCAAVGSGLHPDMRTAAEAMAGAVTHEFQPDGDSERYAELLEAYRDIYPALQPVLRKLAQIQ